MSLSLFCHACQRMPQAMCRQSSLTVPIRLYARAYAQNDDAAWRNVLKPEMPSDDVEMSEQWTRHSQSFLAQSNGSRRDAYYGRSVRVMEGDVGKAARTLDNILAQNSVAREWFTNRRHKQKGEERRRLSSMRWRRRFKHEVGRKVELVQQIRRRGA